VVVVEEKGNNKTREGSCCENGKGFKRKKKWIWKISRF
jgi:hypothetical protein